MHCLYIVPGPCLKAPASYMLGASSIAPTDFPRRKKTERRDRKKTDRPTDRPTATVGYTGVTMNVRPMSMPGFLKILPMGRLRNSAVEGWKGLTISVKKFAQCNATHRIAHSPHSYYSARVRELRRRGNARNSALTASLLSPPPPPPRPPN